MAHHGLDRIGTLDAWCVDPNSGTGGDGVGNDGGIATPATSTWGMIAEAEALLRRAWQFRVDAEARFQPISETCGVDASARP